jgi:hypothetical protein
MTAKRLGRPKGSKNAVDAVRPRHACRARVVVVERSHCPKCGRSRRSEYWGRMVQKCPGLRADGTAYTAIIRRRPATARLWPCQGAGASIADRCGLTRSAPDGGRYGPGNSKG